MFCILFNSLQSARVKHTQAVKEQQSASKSSSAQSTQAPTVGGGDLMADLFNKLSMRRKVKKREKQRASLGHYPDIICFFLFLGNFWTERRYCFKFNGTHFSSHSTASAF